MIRLIVKHSWWDGRLFQHYNYLISIQQAVGIIQPYKLLNQMNQYYLFILIGDVGLRLPPSYIVYSLSQTAMNGRFVVRPKYIFKHPFNKYDLISRLGYSQELTDFFNYGFNEDTFNCYLKLMKRFIEALDHRKHLHYFDQPSELMRLNDEIPMDLGGFCKFHDPTLVDKETPQNFHCGEPLMRYFIMMIYAGGNQVQYPLVDLVRSMYEENEDEANGQGALYDVVAQIGKNLEEKYRATMNKLAKKQNSDNKENAVKCKQETLKKDIINKADKEKKEEIDKHCQNGKTQLVKIKKNESQSQSDSDYSQSTQTKRRRRKNGEKKKKRKEDNYYRHNYHKNKTQSRQRHKQKKVKKDKHQKRSKSYHKKRQ